MNSFNLFFISFLIGAVVYSLAFYFQVNNKYTYFLTALLISSLILSQKEVFSKKTIARLTGIAFTLFMFYFIFGFKF